MRLLPLLLPLARLATARVLGSWANSDASSVRVGSEIGGVDGGMTNGEGSIIERAGRWMVKGQGNGVRMVEGLMKKLGQGVKEEEEEEEEAAEQAVKKRAEKRDQKEWQILGLTRFPNMQQNTTTWQFTIVDDAGKNTSCSLPSPTSDPSASFYGIPCSADTNTNYKVSWGYNSDADSAVMTVCYVPNGTDAWFGYDKVSTIQVLGDSKKEPIYYTGCA